MDSCKRDHSTLVQARRHTRQLLASSVAPTWMSTPTQAAGAGSLTEEDHSLRQTQGKEWAKSGAQVSSVGGDYAGPRVKETARRRDGETATGGDGEGDGGEENRVQGSGFRVQGSGFRVQGSAGPPAGAGHTEVRTGFRFRGLICMATASMSSLNPEP